MKKQKQAEIINTLNYAPGVSMPNFGGSKIRTDSEGKELPGIKETKRVKSFWRIFDTYNNRPEYSVIYSTETKTAKIYNLSRGFVSTIKH